MNGSSTVQNNYQQDGATIIDIGGRGNGADSGNNGSGIGIVNPGRHSGIQDSDLAVRCRLWTQSGRQRECGHQVRHQSVSRHGV